jgi:hypothetical protein
VNERIEDLMYHAGLTATGSWDEMDKYDQVAIMKFAELIVRECMSNLYLNGYDDAMMQIKQHFGVKE